MESYLTGFHVVGSLLGLFLLLAVLGLFLWAGWKVMKWITGG
ncbi:hypothetical protein [Thermococcus sp.]|nr:hypothetical protein [Thermococcus sp.]